MKKTSLPTYKALLLALDKSTMKFHPSQVHGVIAGILCGDVKKTAPWEELVTGSKDPVKTHHLLQELYELSAKQLKDFSFEFELVLPKDSEPLPERAEALTLWCQGFLTGLKLVNVQISDRPASETTDTINDLIEIAKMNHEDVIATEEDEIAYTELEEFVRMAVILIYQNLHESRLPKNRNRATPKHLH